MTDPLVKGTFHLKPGTRLICRESDGVILSERPLRALRVNLAALGIIEQCREGLPAEPISRPDETGGTPPILNLLDRLCQIGLLEWRPLEKVFEPLVSIVIPVYNRAHEISACLESLFALDYPPSKREIIVIDDASTDQTRDVVRQWEVKLISLERNMGQSAARNRGVAAASGVIIACVDSDCTAEPSWLRDLVPYFQDSRNVLVGGYVDSFYRQTRLDRYEEAASPLNMGEEIAVGKGSESDFYVPTCNVLVKRDAYLQVGGLDETLRVGEDVDLCWRLKEAGFRLLYVPKGRVKHKHRNRFLATFARRFDYGTSEPVLYAAHSDIMKRFPLQYSSTALLLTCVAGLLMQWIIAAPVACFIVLVDALAKRRDYRKRMQVTLSFGTIFRATVEKHFHLFYHLCHHLIRYHVILLVTLAIFFTPLIPLVAVIVLFPALVAFLRKRPQLGFLWFLGFFVVEQAFYQAGVFWGSLRHRCLRPYHLVLAPTKRGKSAVVNQRLNPELSNIRGSSMLVR